MDDLEFVQRCINGDKPAWDQFVEKYSRLIYKYIHSILKIKSSKLLHQDNINDLFQNIILSLVKDNFRKLGTFKARNNCSLASWLRQVVINATLDYLRSHREFVSLETELGEDLKLKDILRDNSFSVKDKVNQEERFIALRDCIERLELEERYFLALHIDQAMSLDEIKEHFGISRGAVDMRKARIVEQLRDCFKTKGFTII
jgi:RNA polymerase sigma-70 factor (ECF subfamily)